MSICQWHECERYPDGACPDCEQAERAAFIRLVEAIRRGDWLWAYQVWRSFPEIHSLWERVAGSSEPPPTPDDWQWRLVDGEYHRVDDDWQYPPGLDRGFMEE